MENITAAATEKINKMIASAVKKYHASGDKWTTAHELNIAEINGAIILLETITGKKYVFSENGLQERSNA